MRLTLRKTLTAALAFIASAALLLVGTPTAFADNIGPVNYLPATTFFAVADATANYTNATTTASDITGASITIPKSSKPLTGNSTGASATASAIRVCYYADAGKATATTGTITVLVNGVSVAGAARTINTAAVRGSLSACYVVARPVATSLVVKLQGVSADTNTFTVYNAELSAEVLYFS